MEPDVEAPIVVATAPKHLKADLERKCTALGQGICGCVAVALGIALFLIKPDANQSQHHYIFDAVANSSVGIWSGLMFSAAAVTGLVRREQKSMVFTYFALSFASLFFAAAILTTVSFGISATIENEWDPMCPEARYIPCCMDISYCPDPTGNTTTTRNLQKTRNTDSPLTTEVTTSPSQKTTATTHPPRTSRTTVATDQPSSPAKQIGLTPFYSWDISGSESIADMYNFAYWHRPEERRSLTTPPPPTNHSSKECADARSAYMKRIECVTKVKAVMGTNQAVYGALAVVSVIEVFLSSYACVAALVALCYKCTWCSCRSFLEFFRRRPREIIYVAYPLSHVDGQLSEGDPFMVQNANPSPSEST